VPRDLRPEIRGPNAAHRRLPILDDPRARLRTFATSASGLASHLLPSDPLSEMTVLFGDCLGRASQPRDTTSGSCRKFNVRSNPRRNDRSPRRIYPRSCCLGHLLSPRAARSSGRMSRRCAVVHLPVLGRHFRGETLGLDATMRSPSSSCALCLGLPPEPRREPKLELRHPRCLPPFDIPEFALAFSGCDLSTSFHWRPTVSTRPHRSSGRACSAGIEHLFDSVAATP